MDKSNLPKVRYKGQIEIGDFKISCAVLDNGERILVDRSLSNALGIKGSGSYWQKKKESKGAMLPEYISANYLAPFIDEETYLKLSKPVIYIDDSKEINEGIPATALIDICDIWHKANKKGALDNRENAKLVAENAYIIFKGFANIGITALVDEATGYQYDREKDALQVILQAYISNELLKWQQKFPDTFYFEIFRLNNWDYTVNGIKKRPGVIGTWTNELIYKQLPKGVLDELKSKTPKSESGNYTARFFQSLTPDIGHPALTAQIYKVIGIMNISSSWDEFKSSFNRMVDRANGQTELNFDEIEREIDKIEEEPIKLSSFNKKLSKALKYNPKEDYSQTNLDLE